MTERTIIKVEVFPTNNQIRRGKSNYFWLLSDEKKAWMKANIGKRKSSLANLNNSKDGDWACPELQYRRHADKYGLRFYFVDPHKAVLFKLMWDT
jgi:hypothetical protein